VSEVARLRLAALGGQLLSLKQQIVEFDRMILAWDRNKKLVRERHFWVWHFSDMPRFEN
jgi:transposase